MWGDRWHTTEHRVTESQSPCENNTFHLQELSCLHADFESASQKINFKRERQTDRHTTIHLLTIIPRARMGSESIAKRRIIVLVKSN